MFDESFKLSFKKLWEKVGDFGNVSEVLLKRKWITFKTKVGYF